jgi:hypothetical protein
MVYHPRGTALERWRSVEAARAAGMERSAVDYPYQIRLAPADLIK